MVLPAQVQTTFHQAFRDGQRAEAQGQWRKALAAYGRAVELRPEPGARVLTYGLNLLEGYWPYQRMARCHLELGELGASEALLARSARLGEPEEGRAALRKRLEETRGLPTLQAPVPAKTLPEPVLRAPDTPKPGSAAEVRPPVPSPVPPPKTLPHEPTSAKPPREAVQAERGLVERKEVAAVPPRSSLTPELPPPASLWPWFLAILVGGGLLAGLGWRLGRRRGAASELMPDRLGPYRVAGLLGRGGFAITYKGIHEATGATVALKLPHAHILLDEDHLRRFEREARLGMDLSHPNLVKVLGVGRDGTRPFLVMEFVEGVPLDRMLATHASMAPSEAIAILGDLAEALAFAHARQVVHRDLKPGNVMITPNGARLMDLGIARSLEEAGFTTTQSFMGTPQYAAPETLLGEAPGPPSDLYGLGAIAYEMLAGRPPHAGVGPMALLALHARGQVPDPACLPQGIPPGLAALVMALLAPDPSERPTAVEAAEGLKKYLA